jgi:polar amino acid transport system permease protein
VDSLAQALDGSLFWEYRSFLLKGLAFNFYVWICAAVLAHGLGLGVCLLRISRWRLARAVGTAYAELFRNTPEYILLTWVHFVAPLLLSLLLHTKLNFTPFVSAVLALGLAYSGYLTETYRSGIQAIPKGQIEVGRALGISSRDIMLRLVLPQAVRHVLPELLNQMVSLFKATTLVSLIAVPDLLYNVVIVTQEEMRPLPLYTWAAIVYCTLIFCASAAVRGMTERWRRRGWVA